MDHVYWIIEGLLGGRAGPTLHPWDPQALYDGGIRTLVSLAEEDPAPELSAHRITTYWGRFPPVMLFSPGMRKAFIHQALPVWAFIHEQVTAGKPTVVHCFAGNDRTGVILGGYLITYRGTTPEDALRIVRTANPRAMSAVGYAGVLQLLTPGQIPDPRTLL
jgi:hypothetical protein